MQQKSNQKSHKLLNKKKLIILNHKSKKKITQEKITLNEPKKQKNLYEKHIISYIKFKIIKKCKNYISS